MYALSDMHDSNGLVEGQHENTNEATMSGAVMATTKWTAVSADFVYTVCLSTTMQFCAFGGPEMLATVCDGRTGVRLWTLPCPGTVWSISMLEERPTSRLAVGGDFAEVCVTALSQPSASRPHANPWSTAHHSTRC